MQENKPTIYKNISIKDFDNKFNNFKTLTEKYKFIQDYILSYGLSNNVETLQEDQNGFAELKEKKIEELSKLVYHAREKFFEASLLEKEDYEKKNKIKLDKSIIDPSLDPKSDLQISMQRFIVMPGLSLGKKAQNLQNEHEFSEGLDNWKNNLNVVKAYLKFCEKWVASKTKSFDNDVIKEKGCKEMHSSHNVSAIQALNRNKAGLFERWLRRTSSEYKDFEKTYKDFYDENNKDYNNKEKLEASAKAYLHHKIPGYSLDSDELPKPEDIARFSGKSKNRIQFCIGVLKGIKETRERINTIEEIKINAKNAERAKNQEIFQEDLNNNVEYEVTHVNKAPEVEIIDKNFNNEVEVNNNDNNIIKDDSDIKM